MTPADPMRDARRGTVSSARLAARAREDFDVVAANAEMVEKLRRNGLRRRARSRGLDLRHSDRGYSLVDHARVRVGGRSNLTLDEVETHLGSN